MTGTKRVRLPIVIMVGLGSILLVTLLAVGTASSSCSSCHEPSVESLDSSAHASLDCYACHPGQGVLRRIAFRSKVVFDMYPADVFSKDAGIGPVVRTGSRSCSTCHPTVLDPEHVTESRGLRIRHGVCVADAASCDSCHLSDAHPSNARPERSLSMGVCVECHTSRSAPLECASCHTTGYVRDDLLRGPFAVTHGVNWEQTHGLGDLRQCVVCHQEDTCVKCHGVVVPHEASFGATHGDASLQDDADCTTCHASAFCDDCHQTVMPHPDSFLPEHSSIAEDMSDPACVRCHEVADCQRCHEYHVHPGGARGVPVPPKPTGSAGGS